MEEEEKDINNADDNDGSINYDTVTNDADNDDDDDDDKT